MFARNSLTVLLLMSFCPVPSVAQQTDSIEVTVILSEFQEGYSYAEEHNGFFSHYSTEKALYTVASPDAYAGRTVQVVFIAENAPYPQEPSSEDIGDEFSISLPGDYFDFPDRTIIRNSLVRISPDRTPPEITAEDLEALGAFSVADVIDQLCNDVAAERPDEFCRNVQSQGDESE